MPRDTKGKPIRGDESMEAGGMADMKRTPSEKKGENKAMAEPYKGPDYPYGTRIHLDHESLKKVGMTDLPEIGHEVEIRAKAHVSSASAEKREGEEERRHLELQITHLGISHKADNMKGEDQGGKAKRAKAGHVTDKEPSYSRKRH